MCANKYNMTAATSQDLLKKGRKEKNKKNRKLIPTHFTNNMGNKMICTNLMRKKE